MNSMEQQVLRHYIQRALPINRKDLLLRALALRLLGKKADPFLEFCDEVARLRR